METTIMGWLCTDYDNDPFLHSWLTKGQFMVQLADMAGALDGGTLGRFLVAGNRICLGKRRLGVKGT